VNNNLHFRQNHFTLIKLVIFLTISIYLIYTDKQLKLGNDVRNNLSHIIQPIYIIAESPYKLYKSTSLYIDTKKNIIKENNALKKKVLVQSGIIQQIPPLKEENKRLKKLLGSSSSIDTSKILIAELIKVNLSPFSNKVIINKVNSNNLFLGQSVVDSFGVLGVISEINKNFSVVTLITDPGHAILAVNARTDKRIVLSGTGDNRKLKAKYISLNEDIIEGDILITSGLDNVFPGGYTIGEISVVKKKLNQNFLNVEVRPSSILSSNREVMLLW